VADRTPPNVLRHSWGQLEVQGIGLLGDAKLWPGGGREWDWSETDTHHRPGIQPADVAELLLHDVEVVVLSRGRELVLQTQPETIELVESRGITVVQQETSVAISTYNGLVDSGHKVAALLHSTC
jgi:hypothetical protein